MISDWNAIPASIQENLTPIGDTSPSEPSSDKSPPSWRRLTPPESRSPTRNLPAAIRKCTTLKTGVLYYKIDERSISSWVGIWNLTQSVSFCVDFDGQKFKILRAHSKSRLCLTTTPYFGILWWEFMSQAMNIFANKHRQPQTHMQDQFRLKHGLRLIFIYASPYSLRGKMFLKPQWFDVFMGIYLHVFIPGNIYRQHKYASL